MGKEAHISNLFKDLNHLLKKQQDKFDELDRDNRSLKQKLEILEELIKDETK
jgi:hypothetical protein